MSDSTLPNSIDRIRRWSLWIDGVGGFAIIDDHEASIGRTGCDIEVIGDVSRNAGRIVQRGEDWFWIPKSNANSSTAVSLARHDDTSLHVHEPADEIWIPVSSQAGPLPIGGSVDMTIRRPSPLSTCVRLDVRPPHRWDHSVDAFLIGTGVIVIGSGGHIPLAELKTPCVVRRDGDRWQLQCGGRIEPLVPSTPVCFDHLTLVMQPWVSSANGDQRPLDGPTS